MRSARTIVSLAFMGVSLVAPSFAQNLITNPSFDSGVSGWSNQYIDRLDWIPDDGNAAGSGPGCMEIADTQNNGGCNGAIQIDVAVTPNTTYELSGTARLPAGSVAERATIWVVWYDVGRSYLGMTSMHDVTTTVDGPWTTGSWKVQSPTDAVEARVRPSFCMPSGGAEESVARWDDLFFGLQDPEIFSDGFESGDVSGWTTQVGCITEGEIGSGWLYVPCCPGLTEISCSEPTGGGGCMTTADCYLCTSCGDGICGTGENICNCPEDC